MEDCPRTSKVNQLDELGLGLKYGREREFSNRAFADVEQSQELEFNAAVSQLPVPLPKCKQQRRTSTMPPASSAHLATSLPAAFLTPSSRSLSPLPMTSSR